MFVWCDLETTGLEPKEDVILSLGFILTDAKLRELARFEAVASHPARVLERMSPVARAMHERSGLIKAVADSTKSAAAVEYAGRQFLDQHVVGPAYLAGNSIHFDRSFMAEHMPSLLRVAGLSHRLIDVSTFKALASMWLPSVAALQLARDPAHTAIKDLEATLAEFAYWRRHMFAAGVGP